MTVYLAKIGQVAPEASTPVEPDLLAEATGGISPIPRVTEEIKWRPATEDDANTSIFDRVDEFIELPVEDTVVAESFYTCSSNNRPFTVYWRMVLAYGRG